ncbi:unnamed protein product [Coregonus sp. 'balchen']|nr:unnamed protein product [Coregonus sp. 'balchen']
MRRCELAFTETTAARGRIGGNAQLVNPQPVILYMKEFSGAQSGLEILCSCAHGSCCINAWESERMNCPDKEGKSHCIIHREALASNKMSPELHYVLNDAVKSRPLNHRLFERLCDDSGTEYQPLLLNMTSDTDWGVRRAYLADVFSKLNNLNLTLQVKDTHILNMYDKVCGFMKMIKLWERICEDGDISCFQQLDTYSFCCCLVLLHYNLVLLHYSLDLLQYSLVLLHYSLVLLQYNLVLLHYSLVLLQYSLVLLHYNLVLLQYSLVLLHYSLVLLQYSLVLLQYSLVLLQYNLVLLHYSLVLLQYSLVLLHYNLVLLQYSLVLLQYSLVLLQYSLVLLHYSLVLLHYSLVLLHYNLVLLHYSLVLLHYNLVLLHYSLVLLQYSLVLLHYSLVLLHYNLVLLHYNLVLLQPAWFYYTTTWFYYSLVLLHYNLVLLHYSLVLLHYNLVLLHYSLVLLHYSLVLLHYSLVLLHYNLVLLLPWFYYTTAWFYYKTPDYSTQQLIKSTTNQIPTWCSLSWAMGSADVTSVQVCSSCASCLRRHGASASFSCSSNVPALSAEAFSADLVSSSTENSFVPDVTAALALLLCLAADGPPAQLQDAPCAANPGTASPGLQSLLLVQDRA